MPRASWNGFLRLSLVSCPVSLVPATTEGKRIRFNQLNAKTGNRVQQQLIDSKTGEVVDRDDIVKGYEYDRGRYATISDDELKALQIESSKIIDLNRFVDRDEVDPIYLDTPYYVYPDGELAAETFRVIGEAMTHKNKVGLGKVTISSRERRDRRRYGGDCRKHHRAPVGSFRPGELPRSISRRAARARRGKDQGTGRRAARS